MFKSIEKLSYPTLIVDVPVKLTCILSPSTGWHLLTKYFPLIIITVNKKNE